MKRVLSHERSKRYEIFLLCNIFLILVFTLGLRNSKPIPVIDTGLFSEVPMETHILTDSELSGLYSYNIIGKNDTCLEISSDDADRLMRLSVVEDNTSAESQAYIMAVVLNRVASPDFPNTIKEVIEERGQFSTVSCGAYKRATPDVNSHLALAMIESGQIETDALYFEAHWASGTWQSTHRTYLCSIGGTRFYE